MLYGTLKSTLDISNRFYFNSNRIVWFEIQLYMPKMTLQLFLSSEIENFPLRSIALGDWRKVQPSWVAGLNLPSRPPRSELWRRTFSISSLRRSQKLILDMYHRILNPTIRLELKCNRSETSTVDFRSPYKFECTLCPLNKNIAIWWAGGM